MFIVTLTNEGNKFWLRGTTWGFTADRANCFLSKEDAEKAITKAKKFMTPAMYRKINIEEVTQ